VGWIRTKEKERKAIKRAEDAKGKYDKKTPPTHQKRKKRTFRKRGGRQKKNSLTTQTQGEKPKRKDFEKTKKWKKRPKRGTRVPRRK